MLNAILKGVAAVGLIVFTLALILFSLSVYLHQQDTASKYAQY